MISVVIHKIVLENAITIIIIIIIKPIERTRDSEYCYLLCIFCFCSFVIMASDKVLIVIDGSNVAMKWVEFL